MVIDATINIDSLCSFKVEWRIVGTYYHHDTNSLKLIIETQTNPSFLVFEFDNKSLYDTIVDSSMIDSKMAKPLRTIWPPINDGIRPNIGIMAIVGINSGKQLLFIYDDKAETFDIESGRMMKLIDHHFDGSTPLIDRNDRGTLLTKDDEQWYYQAIFFHHTKLWPNSPAYIIMEMDVNNPIMDSDRERYLRLVTMNSNTKLKNVVKWKWASGYVSNELYHIYTDRSVYHFNPEKLYLDSNVKSIDWEVWFKVLKLDYEDYFQCNRYSKQTINDNMTVKNLDHVYKKLLYVRDSKKSLNYRWSTIYIFFGLHLFVATVAIVFIIVVKMNEPQQTLEEEVKSKMQKSIYEVQHHKTNSSMTVNDSSK